MIIIGFSGGFEFMNETIFDPSSYWAHDSAACLVVDGKLMSAIEEERITRVKHTNKIPVNAIDFLLNKHKIDINSVDLFCYYVTEFTLNQVLGSLCQKNDIEYNGARNFLADKLSRFFNRTITPDKLFFVNHHICHAVSTYALSGYKKSMICTIDGTGDRISGLVMDGRGKKMKIVKTFSDSISIGRLYYNVTEFLGFGQFDEYKVMGLAPYGDHNKYQSIFDKLYTLKPNGEYEIYLDKLNLLSEITEPRRPDSEIDQIYKDIAASLQKSVERIFLHICRYYQKKLKQDKLCLAGGVALNCSMNGQLLKTKLFKEIFVQPASNDAGCAIGAALYASLMKDKKANSQYRIKNIYLGTNIGNYKSIAENLEPWSDLIDFKYKEHIEKFSAEMLAEGKIIGWAQGESEFGPRALGNRSILADPRPSKNKDIINRMIKKRETFRPFAPAILEEDIEKFYDIQTNKNRFKEFFIKKKVSYYRENFSYMNFAVIVNKNKRQLLGATTHIDHSSRIQAVFKSENEKFWNLLNEFKNITDLPILLNTSFNNNAEPIVDNVFDVITTLLTTDLNYVVIGNYFVSKKMTNIMDIQNLKIQIPVYANLIAEKKGISSSDLDEIFIVEPNSNKRYSQTISKELFNLLNLADNKISLVQLLKDNGIDTSRHTEIVEEIFKLWSSRLVYLKP